MSNNRIGLSAFGCTVAPILSIVGSKDVLRPQHSCVVSHRELIIGQEQIVIAIVVYHFGSFGSLPAAAEVARIYALAIAGDVSPGIALSGIRLTRVGVDAQGYDTGMPGAVEQIVLTIGTDDVGRINGVVFEVSVPVTARRAVIVKSLVCRRCGDHAFIDPVVGSRIGRLHHADEGTLCPRVAPVGGIVVFSVSNVVVHHNGVVHSVESVPHLAGAWSPEAVAELFDGWQPHGSTVFVGLCSHPRRLSVHGGSHPRPVY